MLDLPTSYAALAYTDWGKKYNSSILYAEALGNRIIILNSAKDADELLERPERAKIYADRPIIPIIDIMGWEINVAIMPYGDQWRRHRRIFQNNFNKKAIQNFEPVQTRKVRNLLQGLLGTPERFEAHSKMFSASLTISMMYGYEVKSVDEPCVTVADEAIMLGTRLLVPGASLINIIPSLRHVPEWFPGASSRKMAAKIRRMTDEVIRFPLDYVKKSFEAGTVVPSLVADFYEKKHTVGATQEEEDMIKRIAYTVYGAASDTTISFAGSFFYLMAVNTDAQRKAHAEIDRVIGSKRLPTLADRESLPYIEAIYREVLRLRPPFPLGVPHSLTEDDYYKGYFIPKASSTVWLMMASVLSCFKITNSKDKDGNDVKINGDFEDNGLMNHKSKFECAFHPRSSASRKLAADSVL
ncbi:hypothetical protein CVT25_013442 [Psilocybe cyanescens]|uniref:Cytochrome P450 n=1 Tax=Psilocybe cyanescens TaxID=93625 RepID=A0A409WT94_PSICY|nr:hypothetical protein CVT25_013442 [Psilocybe cyanescens]